jgi:hypothetical protein
MNIGQVQIDGRTTSVAGNNAALSQKAADGSHAGSFSHISYLGHRRGSTQARRPVMDLHSSFAVRCVRLAPILPEERN